jgi:hypothetical protein
VHKVLWWAFEQQGLDPALESDEVLEGPALPAVDLLVPRIDRGESGYEPVAYRWDEEADLPWHARGIRHDAGLIKVSVRSRGKGAATNAQVNAWWAPKSGGSGAPFAWLPLVQDAPAAAAALLAEIANGGVEIAFKVPPAAPADIWVFAEVSCEADRSNIDPATDLPFAGGVPPASRDEVMELVFNDNNCALRGLAVS